MFSLTQASLAAALVGTALAAGGSDYDYKKLGDDWGDIGPQYGYCKGGKEQSPINLVKEETVRSDKMELNGYGYQDITNSAVRSGGQTAISDNGFKVPLDAGEFQLNFADGSKSIFTPLQFHFHAPSEHSVEGKLYDLEVHLVHYYKGTNTQLGAVIGIFFDVEEGGNIQNDFLESIFAVQEDLSKGVNDSDNAVKLRSFLQSVDFSEYWNYDGSLTTPPCSEGIKWTVIKDVQPITPEQLKKFTKVLADDKSFAGGNGNNRRVQPLNDRTLYYNGAAGMFSAAFAATAAALAVLAF